MKNIQIDDELHRQVKVTAAMAGMSLREFTERALRSWIAPEARTLVDARAGYEVHPNSAGAEWGPAGESCPD